MISATELRKMLYHANKQHAVAITTDDEAFRRQRIQRLEAKGRTVSPKEGAR